MAKSLLGFVLPGRRTAAPAHTYPFKLTERVSAQARNIRIEVRPDGEVRLVIPERVSRRQAHAFVREREAWICRKIAELRQKRAEVPEILAFRWDGNDQLPLRGVATPVRVLDTSSARPQVRLGEVILVYRHPQLDARRLNQALSNALRELARQEFAQILSAEAQRLGIQFQGPRVTDTGSRWGSCTPEGLISLSWRLMLAPRPVCRYVIVHELCHIVHLDHSERFWDLVAQQMPDYRTHRAWLRNQGAQLHQWLPRPDRQAPDHQPPDHQAPDRDLPDETAEAEGI